MVVCYTVVLKFKCVKAYMTFYNRKTVQGLQQLVLASPPFQRTPHGGGGWWVVCKPILVFSLSLSQAEQKIRQTVWDEII